MGDMLGPYDAGGQSQFADQQVQLNGINKRLDAMAQTSKDSLCVLERLDTSLAAVEASVPARPHAADSFERPTDPTIIKTRASHPVSSGNATMALRMVLEEMQLRPYAYMVDGPALGKGFTLRFKADLFAKHRDRQTCNLGAVVPRAGVVARSVCGRVEPGIGGHARR
jgi:hypothetical protein